MKPVDAKPSIYIGFSKEVNDENPKFKIGDTARISKHKNIFSREYVLSWSEKVFVIKNVHNSVPWTYVISNSKGEVIVRTFYEKELQKANRKESRAEKVIKKKGDKLYFKRKCYDNSFYGWINGKRHIINE